MSMEHTLGNPEELAAGYAAGAMSAQEAAEFEAHLASGCAACAAEMRALEPAVADLLAGAQPMPPSPGLRAAVLRRATALVAVSQVPAQAPALQPWKNWSSTGGTDGIFYQHAAVAGPWEETGVPGVSVRRLFVDRANDRMTALFRMQAGSSYPSHRHHGDEECWVLEGELQVGKVRMRAGDFQRAAAGSLHPAQHTEGGCVLLISGSLEDKLVRA